MTLRTPRRRISPRTKRRCRAIKDFLRRALGSSSQPDIRINSSIAINVTDFKHKLNGLEHQLKELNKHSQDMSCVDSSSRKGPVYENYEDGTDLASLRDQSEITLRKNSTILETKLLYKTPENEYTKLNESDSSRKVYNDHKTKHAINSDQFADKKNATKETKIMKSLNKFDIRPTSNVVADERHNLRKHQTQSVYDNFVSNVETSSYHSLVEPRIKQYSVHNPEKGYKEREPLTSTKSRPKKYKDQVRRKSPENVVYRDSSHPHKTKAPRDLDQDFISELIKRQYRPVKVFGKKVSAMSQISAPVCRDQEFTIRDNVLEGSDLCSCCIGDRNNKKYRFEHRRLEDKRSICDARLYSSKKHMRPKSYPRNVKYNDIYNDSEQYDLIPVKEKSSPRSRRNFAGDPTMHFKYKEVPPSPRTQRPRLNLKACNVDTEFEDYVIRRKELKHRNYSPYRRKTNLEDTESTESFNMMEYYRAKQYKSAMLKENQNEKYIHHKKNIINHQNQSNSFPNNLINKTQDSDISGDKTDKALSEIKDILKSFLEEIKKETASGSQCGNSPKTRDKCLNQCCPSSAKLNTSMMPESGLCVGFGVPQNNIPSPFISPFPNSCCYPVLPVCPMNCMQSGLVLSTPSCTCNCANNSKTEDQTRQQLPNESNAAKACTETEELIKEIYKVVAQNTNNDLEKDYKENNVNNSPKVHKVEKCAGDSLRQSKHDAEVATHKIKCLSRSCEAIGSRMTSDTFYSRTHPTYSDTQIEKLSLEPTASSLETKSSSGVIHDKKVIKQNKITKLLRTFGLLKKKKDVIDEVSESESTVEVTIGPKPPFRQEITNYAVHSQEYYHRPPVCPRYNHFQPSMEYRHGDESTPHCHHTCPAHTSPRRPSMYDVGSDYYRSYRCRTSSPHRSPRTYPSAPPFPIPYDHHHHHSHSQVPLCLKEIEVKTIGTQSDRKLKPFFWKIGKRMQPLSAVQPIERSSAKHNFTQTAEKVKPKLIPASKLANINWKTLQAKVNEFDKPDNFSFKTQKKLADGDTKMRNAMLKKLFYKKNPFSPRNFIVRTILGKDKSSFGDAPMMYRPRMFL